MTSELGALLEGFPTLVTFEGFLSRVDPAVIVERGAAVEGLATLLTLVRSHPRVNSIVCEEVREVPERLTAGVTLVGFLAGVNPLVLHKVEGLVEGFPTFLTFKVVLTLSRRLKLGLCEVAGRLCFSMRGFPQS